MYDGLSLSGWKPQCMLLFTMFHANLVIFTGISTKFLNKKYPQRCLNQNITICKFNYGNTHPKGNIEAEDKILDHTADFRPFSSDCLSRHGSPVSLGRVDSQRPIKKGWNGSLYQPTPRSRRFPPSQTFPCHLHWPQ